MPGRIVGFATRACIAGIMIGIICMIQPFVFELFKWGFLLLLVSTLTYIVVSHLPDGSGATVSQGAPEELPIALSSAERIEP